jgi:hypothetical protein
MNFYRKRDLQIYILKQYSLSYLANSFDLLKGAFGSYYQFYKTKSRKRIYNISRNKKDAEKNPNEFLEIK